MNNSQVLHLQRNEIGQCRFICNFLCSTCEPSHQNGKDDVTELTFVFGVNIRALLLVSLLDETERLYKILDRASDHIFATRCGHEGKGSRICFSEAQLSEN